MVVKKTIHAKLLEIQKELKVPKSQYNSHGKFNFRSNEDILDAVKPYLEKHGLTLVQSDSIVDVSGNLLIKSTTTITDIETGEHISTDGLAGHSLQRKGMDFSQISGSASSYARKYSANGMFAIDDAKDSDTMNDNAPQQNQSNNQPPPPNNNVDYNAQLKAALTGKGLCIRTYGAKYNLTKDTTQEELKKHFEMITRLRVDEREMLAEELENFRAVNQVAS